MTLDFNSYSNFSTLLKKLYPKITGMYWPRDLLNNNFVEIIHFNDLSFMTFKVYGYDLKFLNLPIEKKNQTEFSYF